MINSRFLAMKMSVARNSYQKQQVMWTKLGFMRLMMNLLPKHGDLHLFSDIFIP